MSQQSHLPTQPNASTLKIRNILVSNANRLAKDIFNCSKSIDKYEKNLSEKTVSQDLRIKFATIQLPKFISEDEKQSFLTADEELNQKFFQEKMALRHGLFCKTLLKLEEEQKALISPSDGTAYVAIIQSLLPGLPPTSMTSIDYNHLRQSVKDITNAQQIQKHHKNLLTSPPQTQAPAQAMAVEEDRMASLEKQFKELQISLNRLRSSGDQPTPGPQRHTKTRPIQDTKKRQSQYQEDRGKSTSPRRQQSSGLAPPRPRSQSRERVRQVRQGRENQGRENQRPQSNRRGRSNESKHRF